MHLIDTHSHIYLEDFSEDVEEVISSARQKNISHIILPNVDTNTIVPLFELAGKHSGYLFPLLGLHPTSISANYKEDLLKIEQQISRNKIYGIGEIGIDLYWDKTYKKEQIFVFEEQLRWSKALQLPVSIHTREAFPEVIESIYKVGPEGLKGVFHSFTGTLEELKEVQKLDGFLIGINGVITFKNSNLAAVLQHTTLDKIVLETDAPYLAPVPYRGKRNEPAYMWNTAKKVAETFHKEVEEIAEITSKNASKLFSLPQTG
ncbi:MAG: TatD family hydrolase [Tannerellaceae bacterium]|nr:TatD family hydrolase [Tannerellaceae bacterium]